MNETVISATINSLGYLENGKYCPEPDCIAGVHDLIVFLKSDTRDQVARRKCLSSYIIKNDLVPLMCSSDCTDADFSLILKLTVNLCQPALVLPVFNGKLPETQDLNHVYYEIDSGLIDTIPAFTSLKVFTKFNNLLTTYFNTDSLDRTDADRVNVYSIISLMRFLFSIGMEGPRCAEVTHANVDCKREMISAFLESGIQYTLFKVVKSKQEKELCTLIMGIFSLLLRSFPCEKVSCVEDSTDAEKTENERVLQQAVRRDMSKLASKRQSFSSRNFLGGSYVIKNAALNPMNDLVVQKPQPNDPLEGLRKRKQTKSMPKRSQVRDMLESVFNENRSLDKNLAKKVNEFCAALIGECFDRLMHSTREHAFVAARKGLHIYNDVNYFALAKFVLQFIRLAKIPLTGASSVLRSDFFSHLISQCDYYFDSFKTDKDNLKLLVLRAQHVVSAYKEITHLMYTMSRITDETERDTCTSLLNTIFKLDEYREFPYLAIARLKPQHMTRKLLDELVLGTHYYVLAMERAVKQGELVKIQKKKRVARKKRQLKKSAEKKLKESSQFAGVDSMGDEAKTELWQQIKNEVDDCLNGEVRPTEDISPIDVTLNVDDNVHQTFALLHIQRALRTRRVCDAVGLLNAARLMWPNEAFGSATTSVADTCGIVNEIFNAELTVTAERFLEVQKKQFMRLKGDDVEEEEDPASISDEEQNKDRDEESDEPQYETVEVSLDITDYLLNFTKPDIVYWYIYVLKSFDSNVDEVNKACLKMLHRIAFQLGCASRLYMASLFTIFLRVNDEIQTVPKDLWKTNRHFELFQFGFHLTRKFLQSYQKLGERLMAEILFFKSTKECFDIDNGYGAYEEKNSKPALESLWPEELETEVKTLYDEYQSLEEKPSGVDVVDYIEHALSKERYAKQIRRQLKRMGLDFKPGKKARKPRRKSYKPSTPTEDDQHSAGESEDGDAFASDGDSDQDNDDHDVNPVPSADESDHHIEDAQHLQLPILPDSVPVNEPSDDEDVPVRTKTTRLVVDSDDEDEPAISVDAADKDNEKENPIPAGTKRKTRIIESDDEDEMSPPASKRALEGVV